MLFSAKKEMHTKDSSSIILKYHDYEFPTRKQKLFKNELLVFITPW